jgi:hypothetical protein
LSPEALKSLLGELLHQGPVDELEEDAPVPTLPAVEMRAVEHGAGSPAIDPGEAA